MCGIVGAVAERNILPVLIEGLRRLEYRGYDSAGVAVVRPEGGVALCRAVGKVAELEAKLEAEPLRGTLGVAHTRWAPVHRRSVACPWNHEVRNVRAKGGLLE
jgi:glucosamine--fructose-6-phosphate aminotransferase (isomerizing)